MFTIKDIYFQKICYRTSSQGPLLSGGDVIHFIWSPH